LSPPATKMFLLLKKNITNNLRTRKTPSELTERSNLMEDSFTIHQLMKSIMLPRRIQRKHLLPKKKREVKLFHILHPNLTSKRRNLWKVSLRLSENKELGKPPATLTSLHPNWNITDKPKMRRTPSELPEEFKPTEVSFTIHQLGTNITKLQNLLLKPTEKMLLKTILHLLPTKLRLIL